MPQKSGQVIGVMGGGQLGRMLALAGVPLGMRFVFFDPNANACAGHVGTLVTGSYDDRDALNRFAESVDVITYEFENVPTEAAEFVATKRPVWPPPPTLHVAQDRLREKQFFQSLDIETAPFRDIDSLEALRDAFETLGAGILKTRTLGYDGKGQYRIERVEDVEEAWSALGSVPLIYEGLVPFTREMSILAVRGQNESIVYYPLAQNVHHEGILRISVAPAPGVTDAVQRIAEQYAERVLNALQYVGVLAIELFDANGHLLANEMAPRVHNSGHWTIEGSETSQFENHVRAVAGLPLGDTRMACGAHAAMANIIGRQPPLDNLLGVQDAHVHLYGKSEAPKRKIGHVTVRAGDPETVRERIDALRRMLGAVSVS